MTLLSPEVLEEVGREIRRLVSHPISRSDIRRWAIAVHWPEEPPATFVDGATGAAVTAPEEFNPFAWSCAHRTPTADLPGPVGLEHVLNGGLEVSYGVPMRSGDVITAVQTVTGLDERRTRLGATLIIKIRDVWTNQAGDVVKSQIMTVLRY